MQTLEASRATEPLVLKVLNILMCYPQLGGNLSRMEGLPHLVCFSEPLARTSRKREPLHPSFGEAVIRLYKVRAAAWHMTQQSMPTSAVYMETRQQEVQAAIAELVVRCRKRTTRACWSLCLICWIVTAQVASTLTYLQSASLQMFCT